MINQIKKIKPKTKYGQKMIRYYLRIGFKIKSYNHNVFILERN